MDHNDNTMKRKDLICEQMNLVSEKFDVYKCKVNKVGDRSQG